jgi:FixJ family two-component response regulator
MQSVYRSVPATALRPNVRNRTLALPENDKIAPTDQIVHVVSESPRLHDEISQIFRRGLRIVSFRSTREYLDSTADESSCIVLDLELPEMAGLELQRCLRKKASTPIIVIGDRGDVAVSVSAMKAGAADFLTKPVESRALFSAVEAAFAQDRKLRQRKAQLAKLQQRFCRLTRREREVLSLVIGGLLNKQAAAILGISEVTLQIHRSQVMRKMEAQSLADLVRMTVKLRVPYWREPAPSHERRPDVPHFDERDDATRPPLGSLIAEASGIAAGWE